MPWRTIEVSDVLDRFTPAEQSTVAAIQGNSTALQDVISDAVSQAQAMIRAGGNQVDQPGTVPDQLRPQVIAVALWEWISSIPAAKMLCTDQRKDLYEAAQKRLAEVASMAADRERIEIPTNPGTTGAPGFRAETVRHGQHVERRGIDTIGGT